MGANVIAIRISVVALLALAMAGCREDETKTPESLLNRGMTAAATDDLDLAIRCYTEAIRIDPNYTTAYALRALAYEKKAEFDKAATDFAAAKKVNLPPRQEPGQLEPMPAN